MLAFFQAAHESWTIGRIENASINMCYSLITQIKGDISIQNSTLSTKYTLGF